MKLITFALLLAFLLAFGEALSLVRNGDKNHHDLFGCSNSVFLDSSKEKCLKLGGEVCGGTFTVKKKCCKKGKCSSNLLIGYDCSGWFGSGEI
jgi:hypothetical protein